VTAAFGLIVSIYLLNDSACARGCASAGSFPPVVSAYATSTASAAHVANAVCRSDREIGAVSMLLEA
jgi:hypothetical protein